MRLIESLRLRIPEAEHLSDEEVLKRSEGTYVRLFAELDVASYPIRESVRLFATRILNWLSSLSGK
jgi:hypothetical protein